MPSIRQLIPELEDWNNGKGIDVEAWIGCVGDYRKAIGYSAIFWPRFCEIEGCIVREGTSRENVLAWLKQCGGSIRGSEPVMNHLHLDSIQHLGCEDASPERLKYLGEVLREIYECKLHHDFPDRRFEVYFDCPENEDNLSGYVLTFFQSEIKESTSHPVSERE